LEHGDCLDVLRELPDQSVDAGVTDPPYELAFMGKKWDASGVAYSVPLWSEVLRVLKPGGHLLAFGGTRTSHRMVCAIEDAGFVVRDSLHWMYGQGFPKSANQGGGFGTALKPAHEPICLARKPLVGTVAANVCQHGTGAINVDGCRVGTESTVSHHTAEMGYHGGNLADEYQTGSTAGRWPPNLLLSHAADCERVGVREVKAATNPGCPAGATHNGTRGYMAGTAKGFDYADANGREPVPVYRCAPGCPVAELGRQSGESRETAHNRGATHGRIYGGGKGLEGLPDGIRGQSDTGTAARFFPQFEYTDADWFPFRYVAKASRRERGAGNDHPTVKPIALMRWLVRLVTPPGGLVLDPFAGSGTTLLAALQEGFRTIGCEKEAHYCDLAAARIVYRLGGEAPESRIEQESTPVEPAAQLEFFR
jgi:site-specific DNA-methyltransferase (adenine-specific)